MSKRTISIFAGAVVSVAPASYGALYSVAALQPIAQLNTFPVFYDNPQAYQLRIDNNGQAIGYVYESNYYAPVVWTSNGTATDLETVGDNAGIYSTEGSSTELFGENSSGALLGENGNNEVAFTKSKSGSYQASIYSSNAFTNAASGLAVHAMDKNGDLLWQNFSMSSSGFVNSSGVTKSISNSTMQSYVPSMNDSLQFVGGFPSVDQYVNGAIVTGATIAVPNGYSSSSFLGRSINDSGEMVGTLQNSSGAFEPFEWTQASGLTLLNTGSSTAGIAEGIDSEGDIVGAIGSGSSEEAVIWENGTPVNLNTLVPSGSTNLTIGYSISDTGYILAANVNAPYTLSPVPEPSGLAALLPLALPLLRRRKRSSQSEHVESV